MPFHPKEGHTERHNMMLFLLQDTLREVPVGFEKPRRNIFDPAEHDWPMNDSNVSARDDGFSGPSTAAMKGHASDDNEGMEAKNEVPIICARKGCSIKSRFDSAFCSDACGVACLEADLLRTFNYISDVHPSLLRS
jgi:hypothetical protein